MDPLRCETVVIGYAVVVETLLARSSIAPRADLAARIPINVLSISELIGCSANSAATRIAFLIALAFDDP
jgi:hypothetical protein